MNFDQDNIEKQPSDYNVNIQIITFIVITIVIILTLVNFIRIYSNEKTLLLKGMSAEANSLKTTFSNHLNYSKHFIRLIGRNVKNKSYRFVIHSKNSQNIFPNQTL